MAAIVRAHHVRELHFTLVAGRWQYDRWGYPLLGDGAAYGAEAWAWLGDDATRRSATVRSNTIEPAAMQLLSVSMSNRLLTLPSRDEAWSALTNSLAGLFCASLNRFTSAHTTSPRHTFTPVASFDGSSCPSPLHPH